MTTDVGSSQDQPVFEWKDYARVQSSITTERLHAEIDQVFAESVDVAGAVEQVARLGAQLLLQARWRLFGVGVTRTNALEALVIAGFVRGLSVRDVEAAPVDALGGQASVSRSTVSRICEQIRE